MRTTELDIPLVGFVMHATVKNTKKMITIFKGDHLFIQMHIGLGANFPSLAMIFCISNISNFQTLKLNIERHSKSMLLFCEI